MGCRGGLFCSLLLRPAANTRWPVLRPFSSVSSAAGDGFLSFFDVGGEESPAYRRYLQCHRPPKVSSGDVPANTCSLIGTVAAPLRRCDSWKGSVGAYTILEVEKPPWAAPRRAFAPFQILIIMWDELAEVSLKYLKPNDFIYVSGHLSSYEKVNVKGKKEITHKVVVKDLNYVQQIGKIQTSQSPRTIDDKDVPAPACSSVQEKDQKDRLHLWQVFFASPHEWWDNRHQKLYPSTPDFKHKHTCECLRLSPNDPPWIKKQLELYDLEKEETRQKIFRGPCSQVSEFL